MSDITINIRALDLTKGAVDSAMRSLRKLTSSLRVDSASATVGSAFRNLAKDVERYTKMSSDALRKELNERRNAINTLTSMEARYRLHLLKGIGDAERADTRSKLRRIAVLKGLVNREISEAQRVLKVRENADRQSVRSAQRAVADRIKYIGAEFRDEQRMARQAERDERARARKIKEIARDVANHHKQMAKAQERALKEQTREEDRLRKAGATSAKAYLKKIESDEAESIRKRKALAESLYKIGGGAMKGVRRMGFNAIFAGSIIGSQASMLGSQLGGSLGSLGGALSGGFTSLTNAPVQLIGLIGKVVSVATRAAGALASLYTNVITGVAGTLTAFLPSIGIFISGIITGVGNMTAGAIRMVTDLVSGGVELITGAIQGIVNTVEAIVSTALGMVSKLVSGVASTIGSVLGKIGEVAGDVFGRIVDFGVSSFGTMMSKIAEFRNVMVDVFTQVPEYGEAKFEQLTTSVEKLADRLPLAKKELAKGLFEIVSTQLTNSPEEAMKVLTATSEAAVAGGHDADLVSTTKAATAILSAFNLKADQARATLSKLLKAAALGRFAFADLAEGVQNVSGVAANFQTSLDDMLTAYVLASQSMAKQSVPIGVKNLILSLAAPTAEAGKAMKLYGISLKEYTAEEKSNLDEKAQQIQQMEGLVEAYSKVHKKTDAQKDALHDLKRALKSAREEYALLEKKSGTFRGLMESVRTIQAAGLKPEQLRTAIPERRALAAITAIMSAMDRADKTSSAIAGDSGQQLDMALKMRMKVLANQMNQLSNVWENTWNGIYNFVAPMIGRIAETVSGRLIKLRTVIAEAFTPEEIDNLARMVEQTMQKVVGAVFDGVEWIIKNWRRILDTAKVVWDNVVIVVTAAWNIMKMIGEEISKMFGGADELGKKLKDAFDAAVQGAKDFYEAIKKIASGDMEPIIGLIENIRIAWAELTDYMRSSFAGALQFLEGPLNQLVGRMEEMRVMALNPFDALTQKKPTESASDYQYSYPALKQSVMAQQWGQMEVPFKAMFDAMGIKETDENKRTLFTSIQREVENSSPLSGLYDDNKVIGLLQKIAGEMTGGGAGNYGAIRSRLKGAPETDWLAQLLSALAQSSNSLENLGYKTHESKMSAFGKTFDFSTMVRALKEGDAPRVREEIQKARADREAKAKALQVQEQILEALTGSKGPTGALGVSGSVGTTKSVAIKDMEDAEDSDNLNKIEEHTETMADGMDDSGLAPSMSDPEALIRGALKDAPSKSSLDVTSMIALADSLKDDKPPEKKKRSKKSQQDEAQPIAPPWWPSDLEYGKNMSKQDIKKAYKSYNRAQQAKAFQPFGKISGFGGFNDGPGFPTLGAPMRDKDGYIVGFRDFQGPSPKPHMNVGDLPNKTKKPAWRDWDGKTPEQLAEERAKRKEDERQGKVDKLNAMRKAVEMTGDARNFGAFLPEGEARRKEAKKFAKGGFFSDDPSADAPKDAKGVADKVGESTASMTALSAALSALMQAQQAAADGTLQFTEAQMKAISDVGISVQALVAGLEANNNQVIDLIGGLRSDIEARLQAIENKTRQAQVTKGI